MNAARPSQAEPRGEFRRVENSEEAGFAPVRKTLARHGRWTRGCAWRTPSSIASAEDRDRRPPREPLFAPLPVHGIWDSAELSRTQFLVILIASVAVFTFIGGPVWAHARESHFWRLGVSYAMIPPAVLVALWRNHRFSWTNLLMGTAVISVIKLVLTASLLVLVGVLR